MNYNSRYNSKNIFQEHLNFAKKIAEPLNSKIARHTNNRTLDRKLRIGYVSPNFKRHSVAFFIEPVLKAHNRKHFELICYADVLINDQITKRMQGYADKWQSITGLSDEKVDELVRNDKIDILVGLAGHAANNRILLFAREPAPIQLNWIGYPATTGLSTMDYKIVDRYTDPPSINEQFYTERLILMPVSFLCYMPHGDSPDVSELPALSSGHITFGSFNNFAKISY